MFRSNLHRHLAGLAALILSGAASPAWSQANPQDGIDRNLQQREAREREFHATLEDRRGPPPPFAPAMDPKWHFILLPPGSEPPLRLLLPDTPVSSSYAPAERSVVDSEVQLQDSQQRRQMELQTQTQAGPQVPGVPNPGRQQALQIQQLGFDRELRAQDLQSNILRDSARAMGAKP